MLAQGVDLIVCTGGMSVDPDDLTPLAIKQTGAEIVTHGTPVLPAQCFCWLIKESRRSLAYQWCFIFRKTVLICCYQD